MFLKATLGVALLLGAVTLWLAHSQVGGKIQGLNDTNARLETEKTEAITRADTAENAEKATKALLDTANRTLNDTTNALTAMTAKAAEQEKRANDASESLGRITEERNEAQRELAVWRALGLSADQVRAQRDELRKSVEQRDIYEEENKILVRKNAQLASELDKLIGKDREVEVALPAGLKGTIIAVDPKYDFVVLDIGSNQGVLENGKMLVNRDGKLVAKVRVTNVQPTRSIANILPEWKQDEIMEGDQVLY